MRLIKITRSDVSGSYVIPLEAIDIQTEFDNFKHQDVNTSVTLTVVETVEEELANPEEFPGP